MAQKSKFQKRHYEALAPFLGNAVAGIEALEDRHSNTPSVEWRDLFVNALVRFFEEDYPMDEEGRGFQEGKFRNRFSAAYSQTWQEIIDHGTSVLYPER